MSECDTSTPMLAKAMIQKPSVVFSVFWCYSEDLNLGGLSGSARYLIGKT